MDDYKCIKVIVLLAIICIALQFEHVPSIDLQYNCQNCGAQFLRISAFSQRDDEIKEDLIEIGREIIGKIRRKELKWSCAAHEIAYVDRLRENGYDANVIYRVFENGIHFVVTVRVGDRDIVIDIYPKGYKSATEGSTSPDITPVLIDNEIAVLDSIDESTRVLFELYTGEHTKTLSEALLYIYIQAVRDDLGLPHDAYPLFLRLFDEHTLIALNVLLNYVELIELAETAL